MTKYSEKVMMVRGDHRILRRARDYRSYLVQRLSGGEWTHKPGTAPWDYYCNAKNYLRQCVGDEAYYK